MPRQLYEIKDFSGGLNAYGDPRDIEEAQFSQNWNVIVDKTGMLRIVGSALKHINSANINNINFKSGFGLFQFSSDYSVRELIDGSFNLGYEQGTIDDYTNTTTFVLEDTATVSSTNDDYNSMMIFIYEGAGAGESRIISDYVGSTRTVTTAAFATALNDKAEGNPSKYMIFRWGLDNWETSSDD